jgi:hypothetical protein
MPAPLINLDTPGGNQLKPPSIYHLSLSLSIYTNLHITAFSDFPLTTQIPIPPLTFFIRTGVLIRYGLYKKHCMEHTSHLVSALKNFLGLPALEHRGQEQHSFRSHGLLQISFSQTLGIFSIGRAQDIIPQGSKDSIRSNLQNWVKGAWMTHYHVSGFAAFVLSAILCLETYTGPIWNCNCHLPLVSSWDISKPPSLGGSVRRA